MKIPGLKKISDRLFTTNRHQIKNVNAGYDNHVVVQEIDATAFKSQSLSDFSLEELGISENTHCVAFPECGLPVLLILQRQGKL
ncbi:hypothetical protein Cl131_gp079 [Aphanizomenon phage vB_AphaS-CL131]|nr:hypothetical protein Cl131_gp079 [Aphanizomenon phage vB_AphaS-CL131]